MMKQIPVSAQAEHLRRSLTKSMQAPNHPPTSRGKLSIPPNPMLHIQVHMQFWSRLTAG
jgi:hypothetical protein